MRALTKRCKQDFFWGFMEEIPLGVSLFSRRTNIAPSTSKPRKFRLRYSEQKLKKWKMEGEGGTSIHYQDL